MIRKVQANQVGAHVRPRPVSEGGRAKYHLGLPVYLSAVHTDGIAHPYAFEYIVLSPGRTA